MKKILLVDDDQTMCKLLKTFFELEGFVVALSEGQSKEEVINKLAQTSPHIILMDVHLKHANGLEIAREIRSSTGTDIRILISSGMPLHQESLEAGANDFILKPYMPQDLIDKVNELI